MAGNTTVYDVKIQYSLDDKASVGLNGIAGKVDHLSSRLGSLERAWYGFERRLVTGAFRVLKGYFIDFNRELQRLEISTATILQANGIAKTFEQGQVAAKAMNQEYIRFAKKAPGELDDYVNFQAKLMPFLTASGMKDTGRIVKMVEHGFAAAGIMHEASPEVFARRLGASVMRGVTSRDTAVIGMLAWTHGGKDGTGKKALTADEYNKYTPQQRIEAVERINASAAMQRGIEELGNSFDGVLSTLNQNLKITFSAIGLPLFRSIGFEIKSWNIWLDSHQGSVLEWSRNFTAILKTGFDYIKQALSFIIEHKDLIAFAAKAYVSSKLMGLTGGGGAGGAGGGMFGGVSAGDVLQNVAKGGVGGFGLATMRGADKLNTTMMTVEGAFSGLPGPIGNTAKAFLMIHSVLQGVASWWEGKQRRDMSHKEDSLMLEENLMAWDSLHPRVKGKGSVRDMMGHGGFEAMLNDDGKYKGPATQVDAKQYMAFAQQLRTREVFTPGQGIDDSRMAQFLNDADKKGDRRDRIRKLAEDAIRFYELGVHQDIKGDNKRGNLEPPTINVNISKIEVASEDPDRFVMDMIQSFSNIARNGTQAKGALR